MRPPQPTSSRGSVSVSPPRTEQAREAGSAFQSRPRRSFRTTAEHFIAYAALVVVSIVVLANILALGVGR
jgi:hypothetical protein